MKQPNTATDDPRRANDLKDKELPTKTCWHIENEDPNRAIPNSEKQDP
jgi:hypothetical protein